MFCVDIYDQITDPCDTLILLKSSRYDSTSEKTIFYFQKWLASDDGHSVSDLNGWKAAQVVVFLEKLEDLQTKYIKV